MHEHETAHETTTSTREQAREHRRDWMRSAPCVGYASLFFAPLAERPQGRARREARARTLCLRCEARIRCRDVARQRREFGFWGGENEDERTRAGFPVPDPVGARRRRAS